MTEIKEYDDWDQVVKPFHKSLLHLGEKFPDDSSTERVAAVASEIAEADRLYREWRRWEDGWPAEAVDGETYMEGYYASWWAYWAYVGEHIHRWWF